jgi:hypothetical protein
MDLDATGVPAGGAQRHRGRPRAKLALVTWAGAFAVILLVLTIAGPAMAGWPLALRALVVSGLMVAAMTWVIVPVMTRRFGGWLLRQAPPDRPRPVPRTLVRHDTTRSSRPLVNDRSTIIATSAARPRRVAPRYPTSTPPSWRPATVPIPTWRTASAPPRPGLATPPARAPPSAVAGCSAAASAPVGGR